MTKNVDPLPLPKFDDPQEAPEITKWLYPENKSDTWQVTQEVYDRLVALEDACNHSPDYKPKPMPLFHFNVPAKCFRKGNLKSKSQTFRKMQVIRLDCPYSPPSPDDNDNDHGIEHNDQKRERSASTAKGVMSDLSTSVIHKDELMDLDMLMPTLSQKEDTQGDKSLITPMELDHSNIDTTIVGDQQNVIHSSLDSNTSTKQDKQKQQTRQQESIFSTCNNTSSDPSTSFMHVDALSGIRRATAVAAAPNPERIYEGLSSAVAAHPPSTLDQSSRLKFSAARNINDFISIRRPSSSKQDKGLFVNMDCMLVFTFIRAGATKDNKHSTSSLDFRQM